MSNKYFFNALCISFSFLFSDQTSAQKIVEEIVSQADIKINGTRSWDIQVHDPLFYSMVIKEGSLGFGESYMLGFWDSERLDDCIFHLMRARLDENIPMNWNMRWEYFKAKFFNRQTRELSKKVIDVHYQLGNELFKDMLGPTMAYSCGYWDKAKNLNEAQEAKFDLIARKLGMKPGMTVLDIGCGWGGFAKYIAKNYGVKVVGITLSENQAVYARQICQGLPVEIRVQDYRDLNEKFDRIVEIGMFEHVGIKNYRSFMEIVHRSLNDEGLFMLHTIGCNYTYEGTCDPWIEKYIFPGGHLPSIVQIGESIEGLFVMEDWHNFSVDYDKTLMAWWQNFDKSWPKFESEYPETFYRMWKFYLMGCAGGFRARNLQLWQVVLSKEGVLGGYKSVR